MKYNCLNKQVFSAGIYSIVPIRIEDRYKIMNWRNEQMYHLRQKSPLSKESQDKYFEEVILELFEKEKPNQILFSFLKKKKCIGYGGLVHINWTDMNAEISFIMDTKLELLEFSELWRIFLGLIEVLAFEILNFHKIYTYAFDLRPRLYPILTSSGYNLEACFKEHSFFEGKFIDVLVHSKINRNA